MSAEGCGGLFGNRFERRTPASAAHADRARRLMPDGISHNVRHARPHPLAIERARGSRKWDLDGHDYIDFGMGNGSLLLGHNRPEVVEAVVTQLARTTGTCSCHELENRWAEMICDLVPSAELVRFCGTGSEATALALRVARAATGRNQVIRLAGHYHGWHDGVLPGHDPLSASDLPGVSDSARTETTVLDADEPLSDIAASILEAEAAALILEPSGPRWGAAPLRTGVLETVRTATREAGTVLVFDEVITGFRYAPGGAQQRFGVTPDLTALGKIVAGGLPGAALVGSAELMDLLSPRRPDRVFHRGTFNANPLSAAAGIRTLELLSETAVHDDLDTITAAFRRQAQATLDDAGVLGLVHGEASIFHLHLAAPGGAAIGVGDPTTEFLGMHPAVAQDLLTGMRVHGVDLFSYKGGVLSTAHTTADLERAIDALRRTVADMRDAGAVATHG